MAEKRPLIVKIPEGATEIDLEPVLMPIIAGLLHSHARSSFDRPIEPDELKRWINYAGWQFTWWAKAANIKTEWVVKYLRANGWEDEARWSPERLEFKKPMKKAPEWYGHDQRYHRISLRDQGGAEFARVVNAINQIMIDEEKNMNQLDEIMAAIVEHADPLDRLAFQAPGKS